MIFSFPWQEGGVVALFKVCRQDSFRCLYPQALRTLASICCVEEGVHQLEKVSVTGRLGSLQSGNRVSRWRKSLPGGHLDFFIEHVPQVPPFLEHRSGKAAGILTIGVNEDVKRTGTEKLGQKGMAQSGT